MIQLICLKSLLFNESIFFPSCVGVHWPCLAQRINISYQFVQGETFEAKPNDVFEKYLFYLFTNSFYHCIRYKAYLVSIIYLSDNMNRTSVRQSPDNSILLLFLKNRYYFMRFYRNTASGIAIKHISFMNHLFFFKIFSFLWSLSKTRISSLCGCH